MTMKDNHVNISSVVSKFTFFPQHLFPEDFVRTKYYFQLLHCYPLNIIMTSADILKFTSWQANRLGARLGCIVTTH